MNGILSLGHFCESHGPCVMLCTQAISEHTPKQPPHSLTVPWCNACKSIDVNNAFVSRDENSTFVSSRTALKQEMAFLLKQACVRSLSCEEETGKEGGTVYFGDSERGHVLSYNFRLPDSLARGFHRLFTVIMLMRDKVHLLNTWPFITAHVRELINYLKTNASNVNLAEQSERSQRVHRLATGTPVGSPRSLVQLTGLAGVFSHIHLWFTWILKAGTAVMTEHTYLPCNPPAWLANETDEGFTLVQMTSNTSPVKTTTEPILPLRDLYQKLGSEKFKIICYCVLLGIQVIVRGEKHIVVSILNALKTLLPENWSKVVPYATEYLKAEDCNFIGLGLQVAVPVPNESSIRLDIVQDEYHLKWTGIIPEKLPTLLMKLMKSIEDERLKDEILMLQVSVFVEEWSNTAQTIFWVQERNPLDKMGSLMKSLQVQPWDMPLIKFWTLQIGLYSKSPCL